MAAKYRAGNIAGGSGINNSSGKNARPGIPVEHFCLLALSLQNVPGDSGYQLHTQQI